MRFYAGEYLYLLLALPFLFATVFLFGRFRKARANRIGNPETVGRLFGRVHISNSYLAVIVLLTGLAFIVMAMARPQYPGGVERIEARGGKVVIALDISLSMLAQDFQPNRLEKAKREIVALVEKLKAQSVGLVVFAGEAFVQCPPTVDYSAFRLFLDVATVGMISDTGTDLADAISVSTVLLDDGSTVDKAVIIFTDGETFEGDPEKMAGEAAEKGIRVFTIGVGSHSGRPIPEIRGADGLKKNAEGEIVISRLNEELLSKTAENGNGKFYRASPGESELDDIYADIKGLKGEEKESKFRTIYAEKYRWFLLPGVLLVAIAAFIPTSRRDENEN
jgi:Ca-activated chloride channel family protein